MEQSGLPFLFLVPSSCLFLIFIIVALASGVSVGSGEGSFCTCSRFASLTFLRDFQCTRTTVSRGRLDRRTSGVCTLF